MKHKTVEQVIKEKAEREEREELRQLRNLKRNLESEIVLEISEDLMEILLTYDVKDL